MKIKTVLSLFLIVTFCIPAAWAELLPGDYQLLEVLSAGDEAPYSWDVKVIKKEDGRLFLIFPKEKFDTTVVSVEAEISQVKQRILFELHFKSADSIWVRVYSGFESDKNVFAGEFQDVPEPNPGRFRLVPKTKN
ncbi:MAG: hypothetical protein WC205_18435 [Opitutaceae bacterium]|jgi:hypothetical protein